MAEYKVLKGNIIYNGAIYRAGSTVDMDVAIAQNLSEYLEVAQDAPEQQPVEQQPVEEQPVEEQPVEEQPVEEQEVNYEDYTISELKEIVEKENVEVVPTGKSGSAVKSDYIRALKQSN